MARNKNQRPVDEFGIAESLGEIRTMPEVEEQKLEAADVDPVIDDPQEFRIAIGTAQMEGKTFVEVSERLFKYLVKNSKTNYITYGDPGVKVFLKGTREVIEKEDKMNAEERAVYESKKLLEQQG